MKKSILKLDDIGRESHGPTYDLVCWAMQHKTPISIGTIGQSILTMPTELADLLKLAIKLGFVEIWNHGYEHVRYDNSSSALMFEDLTKGHDAIVRVLGVSPRGFGFPFNKFDDNSLSIVRETYPGYFVYEVDFPAYKMFTPEYNVFGDGQPRLFATRERVARLKESNGLIVQAHPPRWSKSGTQEFFACAKFIEKEGFVFLRAEDALVFDQNSSAPRVNNTELKRIVDVRNALSSMWTESAINYTSTLSNFDHYFLRRFNADVEKNYFQTKRELYPFRPRKILDVGCGLGNWSLPFALSGECESLVLNDTNATIVQSLRDGALKVEGVSSVTVDHRNLLDYSKNSVDSVDLLVCANAFNYLDPVSFFKLAQNSVISDGRVLLLVQTEAFNLARYTGALALKNRVSAAEVISCYMAMHVRRSLGLIPTGGRHVFGHDEIVLLARIFEFDLINEFVPLGEDSGEHGPSYKCFVFKRSRGGGKSVLTSPEWTENYVNVATMAFGARALREAGLATAPDDREFPFYSDWLVADSIVPEQNGALSTARRAINFLGSENWNSSEYRSYIDAINSSMLEPIVAKLLECAETFED